MFNKCAPFCWHWNEAFHLNSQIKFKSMLWQEQFNQPCTFNKSLSKNWIESGNRNRFHLCFMLHSIILSVWNCEIYLNSSLYQKIVEMLILVPTIICPNINVIINWHYDVDWYACVWVCASVWVCRPPLEADNFLPKTVLKCHSTVLHAAHREGGFRELNLPLWTHLIFCVIWSLIWGLSQLTSTVKYQTGIKFHLPYNYWHLKNKNLLKASVSHKKTMLFQASGQGRPMFPHLCSI